ncbi:MAG: PAS domain-containing protein [Candidatus Desulfacyla sp.]
MTEWYATLRFRIILIVVISVLPALGLVLYGGLEQRRLAGLEARQEALQLARQASLNQKNLITETRHLLSMIAERQAVRNGQWEECSAFMASLLSEFSHYLNFGVIDLEGNLRCSALPYSGTVSAMDRTYFQRVLQTGDFAVGDFQTGRVSGRASVNLACPVQDEQGRTAGVVFASLELGWLNRLASEVQLPRGSTLTLVGGDNVILARHPEPERWVGKSAPEIVDILLILTTGNGVGEAVGVDGVHKLYAVIQATDAPQPAIIYAGIPTHEIYAGANQILARNLIALVVAALLALAIALVFSHLFITRKMNVLVDLARQLTEGNLGARTPFSGENGEIGRLARAFDAMAEGLQGREQERDEMEMELRRSEAKFRTLVEQLPAVAYTAALDETSTTLYVSPQIEKFLGVTPEAYQADPDIWRKSVHPEDQDRVMAEVLRCQADKAPLRCEYRMIARDDRVVWFYDRAELVHDETGRPLFLQGLMLDVTESKKAAEALRRAHDELEKRVAERTAELADRNLALSAEIAERERAQEALQKALEKLKFFAYSVMHDLKSPATAIHGLTRRLQNQYGNAMDERSTRCCEQILKASEHVTALVEQINAYLTAKETPLLIEPVRVNEVLKAVYAEFSPRLNLRHIEWRAPEETVAIRADRMALVRVFRNVVDNALKYGGEPLTWIGIDYESSEAFHIFSIRDNGLGVKEADEGKLFEVFHRGETSRGIEGSGLGLAIVREILERHGGRIWIEAAAGGACFRFSLPKTSTIED